MLTSFKLLKANLQVCFTPYSEHASKLLVHFNTKPKRLCHLHQQHTKQVQHLTSTDLDNKAMDPTGQLPIPKAPRLGRAAPPVRPPQHQRLVPAGNPVLRGCTSQLSLCTCVNDEHLFCPSSFSWSLLWSALSPAEKAPAMLLQVFPSHTGDHEIFLDKIQLFHMPSEQCLSIFREYHIKYAFKDVVRKPHQFLRSCISIPVICDSCQPCNI